MCSGPCERESSVGEIPTVSPGIEGAIHSYHYHYHDHSHPILSISSRLVEGTAIALGIHHSRQFHSILPRNQLRGFLQN